MVFNIEGPQLRTGRRIGSFILDGFGGIHTGGDFIRHIPIFVPPGTPEAVQYQDDIWLIRTSINIPYLGTDKFVDAEVAKLE